MALKHAFRPQTDFMLIHTCLSKMSDFPLSAGFVCVCLRKNNPSINDFIKMGGISPCSEKKIKMLVLCPFLPQ